MYKIMLFIPLLLLQATISYAQSSPHGSWSYNPNVAGVNMWCNDNMGQPVALVVNNSINDVGTAYYGKRVIHMNGLILNRLQPAVTQFWYAHECGHHALPYPQNTNESASDCWAVKALRGLRILNNQFQLQQLVNSMSGLSGTIRHLPGPQRAQLIMQCWANMI